MILIIDDDIAVRTSVSLLLKQARLTCIAAESPELAKNILAEEKIELILLDMNFSLSTTGDEGLELLKWIKTKFVNIPVILITAWGSIPLAVKGMKLGAADFLNKPWDNDDLLNRIKTLLQLCDDKTTALSRIELDKKYNFKNIIGINSGLIKILNTVGRISKTDASVLITGESGTGKELIAEAIHNNSKRNNKAFVKVNLGAIPSTLFESEMFGFKKGSFTDAKTDRLGKFQSAHNGTIFLDEIGELELNNQIKLLRTLQDKTVEQIGTLESEKIDFRIVSATNKDLTKMVESSTFREDLFYRINLITIELPSLRERRDDIPLLVNHFIEKLKIYYGRDKLSISHNALDWLAELNWPGNIRELKNVVERTVLVNDCSILDINHFESHISNTPMLNVQNNIPPVGSISLDDLEKNMIQKTLSFYKGNISKAAKSLGLSRAALYRRMEKFGLSNETSD